MINKKIVLMFILSVVFATTLAFALNVTANAQSYGAVGDTSTGVATTNSGPSQPIALCGPSQLYTATTGSVTVWDRNGDGVMDAWDINNDGIVDRWDPNVSCATVTTSTTTSTTTRLPITGAPMMALIAVATAMMGAGLVLRRSSR